MKSSELAVAILRTDSVLPQFVDAHGDYPQMFEGLLERSARTHQPPIRLRLQSFDLRAGELPAPDAWDGYLITGSRNSVYDDEAWISDLVLLLEEVLRADGKVIGICFGHQLMAHFFGGETRPAEGGWTVGVQENRLLVEEPWMPAESTGPGDLAESRLNLIASHKDQVTRLPDGARLIVTSDVCPIGGFVMGDQVLTLQGHPEFHRDYSRDLMVMRRELLGEETFRVGIGSLDKETDEDRVGEWIINFLSGREQSVG